MQDIEIASVSVARALRNRVKYGAWQNFGNHQIWHGKLLLISRVDDLFKCSNVKPETERNRQTKNLHLFIHA